MDRHLEPEQLDLLPEGHPDATRSRRDLVLINWLMGNWRWMARELAIRGRPDDRILELGAGDGGFGQWLLQHSGLRSCTLRLHGLDLASRPSGWPSEWGWTTGDLLTQGDYDACDVLVANLTLHHFDAAHLRNLGNRIRNNVRLIIASEPARAHLHEWQARALIFAGVNRVTRHDAPASVRAGFLHDELPTWLGLEPDNWSVGIWRTWKGAYRMVAERRAPPGVGG